MRTPTLVFTPPPPSPFSAAFAVSSRRVLAHAFPASIPPPFAAALYQPVSSSTPSLRVVPVRGDGRCLYRAIAKGLAHADNRRLTESLERADADALRNLAWRSMCVERVHEFRARHVVEGSLTAYCRQMRAPSFFGGEAEMLALADVLKVPIRVYLQVQRGEFRNVMTYGEKWGKGTKKAVKVLYTNGNHYDAIVSR